MTPTRPPTTCQRPYCPTLVKAGTGGYCTTHRKTREQADRRDRGTSTQRGYGARHRKWRKAIIARDPLCVHCERRGKLTPATIADHITPLNPDGTGDWSLGNGQGLCVPCHNAKTAADRTASTKGA